MKQLKEKRVWITGGCKPDRIGNLDNVRSDICRAETLQDFSRQFCEAAWDDIAELAWPLRC